MERIPSCSPDERPARVDLHRRTPSAGRVVNDASWRPPGANGIYIPTLCHDPRLAPGGPLRAVRGGGRSGRASVQACETPVSEGMEVITLSPALSEAAPAAPERVALEPQRLLRAPLPLRLPGGHRHPRATSRPSPEATTPRPSGSSRSDCPCPASSAGSARAPARAPAAGRRWTAKPVAICQLKRFAADEVADGDGAKPARDHGAPHGQEDSRHRQWPLGPHRRLLPGPRRPPGDHLRGPNQPGGMVLHGIPPYRLPREVIAAEVDDILEPGGRAAAEQPPG